MVDHHIFLKPKRQDSIPCVSRGLSCKIQRSIHQKKNLINFFECLNFLEHCFRRESLGESLEGSMALKVQEWVQLSKNLMCYASSLTECGSSPQLPSHNSRVRFITLNLFYCRNILNGLALCSWFLQITVARGGSLEIAVLRTKSNLLFPLWFHSPSFQAIEMEQKPKTQLWA